MNSGEFFGKLGTLRICAPIYSKLGQDGGRSSSTSSIEVKSTFSGLTTFDLDLLSLASSSSDPCGHFQTLSGSQRDVKPLELSLENSVSPIFTKSA